MSGEARWRPRQTEVACLGGGGRAQPTPVRRLGAGRGDAGGRRGVPAAAAGRPRTRLVAGEQRPSVARPRRRRRRVAGRAATTPGSAARAVRLELGDDERRREAVADVARAPV